MIGSRSCTIAIAGAGPVGLSVAAMLASGPLGGHIELRILEPREPPNWDPGHLDLRVYALSRASQRILENLGLWESIVSARACPYRRMHVWEGELDGQVGHLTFDSADIGEPDLGHIVEDGLLRDRLLARLAALPNIELSFGVSVAALHATARAVEIRISTGEKLKANLLVAADGSASAVRSLLRAPVTDFSYGQHAVVTHVVTEKPHAETAWQRFLPGGPLAFLPLADGRSSVVWSIPSEHAEALVEEPEESFLRELQVASGGVLGAFESAAGCASFPLRAAHVRRYGYPRVALVGDAAHTVHPLAGQGMNLGLLDAAALAEVLEQAVTEGQDAGDLRVLRRYERRRKGENLKMLLALDGLHRVFRLTGPVLPRLRALGMSAVDATPLAKRFLMREALALGGDLPSTARARIA